MSELAITHLLIEELGRLVPGTHFERDVECSRYNGAFLKPLKKLLRDAQSSVHRSHSE
jgi:hypothetical protein